MARLRGDDGGGPVLPRHLAEYREVDWLDVPTPGNFGTDQHRYVDQKRRSAWTAARHRWLIDHGLVDA